MGAARLPSTFYRGYHSVILNQNFWINWDQLTFQVEK